MACRVNKRGIGIFVRLLITASVVFIKHRAAHGAFARVGKKGFLDYKMQGQRALIRMHSSMEAIEHQTNRMKVQFMADTIRIQRAQRGWGNTDEREYRAIQRLAGHIKKCATVLNLLATSYASDSNIFIDGSGKWIEWLVTKGRLDREQLADLLQSTREGMDGNIPLLETSRTVFNEAREYSEEMDVACASLNDAIIMIIESTKAVSAFCTAQLPLLRS